MAIDIRAVVTCSLGTLISASLSDDYIQGNGLVKCKGSCEIAGVITPAVGTAVTFSYTKDGVTRNVPRKMRVLSSFADPFRRTTKVELGCKLTYLSDLREPEKLGALCDPANASYTQADAEVITLPISASSVMVQCLTELGITASSYPLTNKFSIAEFDFSPGYVQVLADLLVSESYCGYLDYDEVLQVFSLAAEGGTGPVITSQQIIDLGGIGVGALPAEAVLVNYSTLRLKQPDPNGSSGDSPWETMTQSNRYTLPVSYTAADGSQATAVYNVLETSVTYQSYSKLVTDSCDVQRVLSQRLTIERMPAVAVLGGLVTEYLSNGLSFNNAEIERVTNEIYRYDQYGNEVFYQREVFGPRPFLYGQASVPWVFSPSNYVSINYESDFPIEREERYTTIAGTYRKVETRLYGAWARTIAGQQNIANARDSFQTAGQVQDYLDFVYDTSTDIYSAVVIPRGLLLIDQRVETEQTFAPQLAPTTADITNAKYAIGGNPNNGYRTESVAEVEVAVGSPTSKRRLELSLPYAPDDTFTKEGGVYKAVPSDAAQKANLYGRVQNKLLLGNRSGANFQLAPELLPAAPFAALVVQANGLSALYRNNGTSWTMDANGVVVSTDALFWGAVGGTGTFWFPMAPGVTTLPTTPPVVNGVMTVTAVAPVWNETVLATSRTRLSMEVQSLNYPLSALTEVPEIMVAIGIAVQSQRSLTAPAVEIALAAAAPVVSGGTSVAVPVTTVTVAAEVPAVAGGAVVAAPAVDVTVTPLTVQFVGSQKTIVAVPAAELTLSAAAPAISTGAAVTVGATDVALAALVPSQTGPDKDPSFSSVSLLLHLNGSNGSTTFTDSSSNVFTVTGNGNAQISTAQSKFGGASAYFDGSGDFLTVADNAAFEFGSGSLTWEFWMKSASAVRYATIFSRTPSTFASGMWSLMMNYASATSGELALFMGNFSTSSPLMTTSGVSVRDDAWHHIAVVRNGNAWAIYVDGTSRATATWTGTIADISAAIYIGRDQFYVRDYSGYIDELRLTKGVARYTAAFTAPSAPFPNS